LQSGIRTVSHTNWFGGSLSGQSNLLHTPILSPQGQQKPQQTTQPQQNLQPTEQGSSYVRTAVPHQNYAPLSSPYRTAPNYSYAAPVAQRPRTNVRVAQPRPYAAQQVIRPAQTYVSKPAKPPETFWHKHPMVRSATVGAGVGAGAGALTGLVTGRGVLHGAVVGAGAGAGVGVIRSSQIMRRHPILKNAATGGVAGLGLGLAAGGHGTGFAGAGVGSAIGLGYGLYRYLK